MLYIIVVCTLYILSVSNAFHSDIYYVPNLHCRETIRCGDELECTQNKILRAFILRGEN